MASTIAVRTWRPTTPDTIEPDLVDLWREIAGEGRVARAVMSNLVVFRERTDRRVLDFDEMAKELPLDEVAARHPSRVILIEHDRRPQTPCAPFAAGVAVVTFGPAQARYGVEQIAVQSACAEQSLPSIVRRLLRGDVPTSVWWTGDLSQAPPLEAIVAMGRQLVYDSRCWRDVRSGFMALAALLNDRRAHPRDATGEGSRRIDLADVNWRRLTPLRRAIIQACSMVDPVEIDALRRADVHIVHRSEDAALAWLLVGWLSARLGWATSQAPPVEEARNRSQRLHDSQSPQDDDEVLSIVVGGTPSNLTATLNEHRVQVTLRNGVAPFTVNVPAEDEADAVAAELCNLGHDVCLHDAIGALIARFAI